MNEYDDLVVSPAPLGGNEYDDLLAPKATAPLEMRTMDAAQGSADEAGEVAKAARAIGEPYAIAKQTPKESVRRARVDGSNQVMVRNPILQDYVDKNPAGADVSHDDYGMLDKLTQAWHVLTDPSPLGRLATALGAPAVGTGFKKGLLGERQGLARISGDVEGAKRFEAEVGSLPQYPNGAPHYAEMVGQLAGQLGLDISTGGALGGIAGSVVPGVGTAFGAVGGMSAVAGNAAMGRFLMNLDKAEEESGQKLDPAARLGAAAAFGALSTGANMIGVKAGAGAAGELLAEAAARAAVRPGVAAAVGRATGGVVKGGAVGAGLMGTMTAAEAVLEDAAKAGSPGDYATLLNDPARRAKVLDDVTQAMQDGFLLMGGLHLPAAGRNFVHDLRLGKEAAQGKEALQAAMDVREESKTWQRDPEQLRDYAARHGDEEVTVTGEGAAEVPEGLGRRMPDGAVQIPLADYLALVEMDTHRRIADDVQHGPGQLSVNEAKLLADYHSASGRFASREQPQAAANDAGGVFDTWESRGFELEPEEGLKIGEDDPRKGNLYITPNYKKYEIDRIKRQLTALDKGGGGLSERAIAETRKSALASLAEAEALSDPVSRLPDYKTGVKTTVDAFHGTDFDLSQVGFSKEHLGSNTESPSATQGFFFARNPETSNSYVGEEGGYKPIYKQPEDIQNQMFELTSEYFAARDKYEGYVNKHGEGGEQAKELKTKRDAAEKSREDFMRDNIPSTTPNIFQARLTFKNPLVHDFQSSHYREETYNDVLIRAKKEGHDGAILLNTSDGGPLDVIYVAFDKEQIGHRLDNEPRRAAERGQQTLRKDVKTDVTAANDGADVQNRHGRFVTPGPAPDPITSATDANIEGMYLQPLFPDAAAAGMGEGEFKRYNTLLEKRAEALQARSAARASREVAKQQTPAYREREAQVKQEVETDVDNRPVIVAERTIRSGLPGEEGGGGSFRLDRSLVDAVSRPGTAELLRGLVKHGGNHPDELAGLVGYGSGAELVQALVGLKVEQARLGLDARGYRAKLVKEETAARMAEEVGDLKANISAEAREAAVFPAATEVLNAEREHLARMAGAEHSASLAGLRQSVAADFAGLASSEARDLPAYMRATARAGRQAELALLRGDYASAFDAKQRQQISYLYAEQAKAFVKVEKKAGKLLKMYSENTKLDAVSQRYTDQVHGIAYFNLGLKIARGDENLREGLGNDPDRTLSLFIAARNAELGGLIPDAPLPVFKRLGDYNVQDTLQLHDLLHALDFQGRAEKKVLIAGERIALDELVDEAVTALRTLPDKFDPKDKDHPKRIANKLDAPMLKFEQMAEWFDLHDPQGTFHRIVINPLHAAQGLRDDLFKSLGQQLRALGQDKEWNKRLNDEVMNTTLMDPFFEGGPQLMHITRKNLLGIMLNMGNEGNLEVMTKGYGWDSRALADFVERNATKEDWQWVQGIWDTFKTLEPLVKQTYRELADVAPEMVRPNEVVTRHGKFSGGYYPLIKDVLRAETKGAPASDGLFQRGQIQPLPANGYTKLRTGATYPVELNPDLIAAQLRATAHDLAFRGPVIQANKFLMDSRVLRAIKQTFGPEYAAEFQPYLRDIANDGVSDVAGISFINRMRSGARNAVITSLIGLNPGTVMIHGGSAALNSIGELAHQFGWKKAMGALPTFVKVGVQELAADGYNQTVARLTKSPAQFNKLWQEAMDQSAEMRHRMHNFDRDLNEMQSRAMGKRDLRKVWNNFATGFVAYSDIMSAVPTFITARDLAMANGRTLQEAIQIGEKTVRQAHGSQGIVDRARIQRVDALKEFTMFYGYFSHNYSRNRNTWRELMEGKRQVEAGEYLKAGNTALKVMTGALCYALLPSINHALVRHPLGEDQNWMKWMAGAMATQFAGQFIFARDIVSGVVSGFDTGLTPLASGAKSIKTSIDNALIGSGVKEGKVKHGALKEAINTTGLVAGVGTRQIGVAGQFIEDVSENREHPDGFYDWWRGLTSGHVHERKHH